MPLSLHFARLENPSQALRTACGALREPANWTTVRDLVTCPRCREVLGLRPGDRAEPGPERAEPAAPR